MKVLEVRDYELAEFISEEFDLDTIRLAIEMIKRKKARNDR